jgi:peptidoglycan/xylan/chitin deacetylase (PgdA/CDA1 family)
MKQSYFNFGLHGFAHEAMTLENKEVIKSIIEQGVKAAEKLGIKIKSFAAPFDMVEEEEDPEKIFEVLKKNGIKNVTYSGTEHQFEIKRKFSVEQIKKRSGLNLIWLSNYFEGSFSNKKMNEVFRDILKNKNKDAVYCLATHDFTHKNIKNIERLVKFIKNLEAKGEIEILDLNKNVR